VGEEVNIRAGFAAAAFHFCPFIQLRPSFYRDSMPFVTRLLPGHWKQDI
jgi:hypothetical protein